MSKECTQCKAIVPDDANFCDKCGSRDFTHFAVEFDPDEEIVNFDSQPVYDNLVNQQGYPLVQPTDSQQPYNVQQQPVYQQQTYVQTPNYVQPQYGPQTPNTASPQPYDSQSKKNSKSLIFGIVGGIIGMALVVIAVFLALGLFGSDEPAKDDIDIDTKTTAESLDGEDGTDITDSNDTQPTNTPSPTVAYSLGTFDGQTYINEFADIKITLPSGYVEASDAEYASLESDVSECGFFFKSTSNLSNCSLAFESLGAYSTISTENYLKLAMSGMEELNGYVTDGVQHTTNIGGYTYTYIEGTFEDMLVINTYVRKVGNYMLLLTVTTFTEEEQGDYLNMVHPAN